MKAQFYSLADKVCGGLHANEVLLCTLAAERSDFVRFNGSKVRQAGTVEQRVLTMRLVSAGRQAAATLTLAGDDEDLVAARATLARLRDVIVQLPEDPWLAITHTPQSTESEHRGELPQRHDVVDHIVRAADGYDLVGFYAGGTMFRGFANSLGQRNWHEVDSFNLDWSLYLQADKAVKTGYAGFRWDAGAFDVRMSEAAAQLALLSAPAKTIEPGEYRAYLSARALEELTGLLCWGGFSAKARQTRQSPLLRMEHGETLSPLVTLTENTEEGIAAPFQGDGYVKPPRVPLIVQGRIGEPLVSPRSAKEYGLVTNAASEREAPASLDLAPGTLSADRVLEALETGLYVNNLWYLNYSDRPAARITGMTRFATFWVEHGRIKAPVNVMRFDDSIYRMLGENVVDLTREREFLPDTSTYEERSTASSRLPGALLSALRFTL
ncbi:MAG: TldD/PmbA family protein [Rhodospirillaceae bacterium]